MMKVFLCHIVMEMVMDGNQHHFMDLYQRQRKTQTWDGTTQKIHLATVLQKKLSSGVGQRCKRLHPKQKDGWKSFHTTNIVDVDLCC